MLCLRFSVTARASRKCFLYRFRQYQACCLQRLTVHLHSGFQLTTVESDAAKSVHACPVKWRAPQLIAVRPQVQGLHEMNLGRFILALDAVDSAKCEVGASRVSYKSGTLSSLRNQGDLGPRNDLLGCHGPVEWLNPIVFRQRLVQEFPRSPGLAKPHQALRQIGLDVGGSLSLSLRLLI